VLVEALQHPPAAVPTFAAVRPAEVMGFDSFVGNPRAVAIIREMLRAERIPHALLFGGPEGVGKKTLAMMFAKALNCARLQDDFCGMCAACRRAEEMLETAQRDLKIRREIKDSARRTEDIVYFDLHVIEPLTRFILVEQIRQLRNVAYTRPFELSRRVFVIDQAQAVHWQATDLLLKLLEECPETTVLILVCPNRYELRPTLRSRCHLIQFVPVDAQTIVRVLANDGRVPQAQQALVARLAAGSLARAKTLNLEAFQQRQQSWLEFFSSLLEESPRSSREPNWGLLFDSTKALTEHRDEFQETLRIGYSLLSDLLQLLEGQPTSRVTNVDVVARLKNWAPKLQVRGIEALKKGLDEAYRLYARNINLQLCLDALATELHSLLRPHQGRATSAI